MGKYQPLTAFLLHSNGRQLRMTFSEIEAVLGFSLPASKQYQAWWSNNPSNNVMTRAWLEAGYKTEQVDIEGEALTFSPDAQQVGGFEEMTQAELKPGPGMDQGKEKKPYRHPAWGALKGMITIPPGVDLTAPAFENWKALYGEDD